MKTKDKTKESSQHSLCKITRVSLDSRTQYLVQNFPQTCTKVSLFNLLAHEHIYTGCWSNEMQTYILLCFQLPTGCCLQCICLQILHNLAEWEILFFRDEYGSTKIRYRLWAHGMPYLQFGAWSKMLRKQASFSPFACFIEKKSSKLPHKLFLFQFFI